MVVSMIQIIIEVPEAATIKDKRRIVTMTKERLRPKFRISCAEVDLLDSLRFAQLGGAIVSNSREFGEKVMQKALSFVEDGLALKVHDAQIHSELYD